jgi:hypothetical protein
MPISNTSPRASGTTFSRWRMIGLLPQAQLIT